MKITNIVEGYKVLPPISPIDKEKYQPRSGLEGPFRLRNGKVVYYDPQEGSYYDPDTDLYISYDDYKKMDEGFYSVRSNQLKQELENNGWERIPAQEVPDYAKYGYRKNGVGRFYKVIDEPYHSFDVSFVKPRRVIDKLVPLDTLLQLIRGSSVTDDKKTVQEADLDKDVSAQIADLIRKKNSVSSPIARKNIDSQIAQLKKQRDKTKDVNEMDKSSNDYSGWGHSKHEVSNGPDKTAKMMKAKDAIKAARKTLDKAFDNSKKGVEEGDKRPDYVVKASNKPKKVKPNTGGSSKHPYQGKLVGATESSQWGEPKDVLRQVLQTLEREVEWPLTDVMDPQQVKQLLSPLMQAVSQHLNSLDEAEVSNTDYEFTHGKKPGGQGSWFFVAHRGGINFSKDVEGEDYIELHGMSYGDAKKAAVKWAKSKGHTSLFVAT